MRYEGRGAVVGCIFCICMCKYGFIVFLVFVVDGVDVAVGGSPLLGGISFLFPGARLCRALMALVSPLC
jgi:hypothetical protein